MHVINKKKQIQKSNIHCSFLLFTQFQLEMKIKIKYKIVLYYIIIIIQ